MLSSKPGKGAPATSPTSMSLTAPNGPNSRQRQQDTRTIKTDGRPVPTDSLHVPSAHRNDNLPLAGVNASSTLRGRECRGAGAGREAARAGKSRRARVIEDAWEVPGCLLVRAVLVRAPVVS
jgi:hypothetical protein